MGQIVRHLQKRSAIRVWRWRLEGREQHVAIYRFVERKDSADRSYGLRQPRRISLLQSHADDPLEAASIDEGRWHQADALHSFAKCALADSRVTFDGSVPVEASGARPDLRSEEHTSELQSLMRT